MVNALVKYINPKKTSIVPILSPDSSDETNPLLKYITPTTQTSTIPETVPEKSPNPLLKYINKTTTAIPTTPETQKQREDLMNPKGYSWMANVAEEPFKFSTLGKRVLRDLMVSIPMIGAGLIQWPVQAHRQTISEGLKMPKGLFPQQYKGRALKETIIPKEYTQPGGIGYIPTILYNMIFRPGTETMAQLETPGVPKALAKSFYQHPILGPLGSAVSLVLPLMIASSAMPKGAAYPLAAKEGLISPKVPAEPSLASKIVKKAYEKFQESPKALRFKELTGLLPEQIDYFNLRHAYELERADMMSKAGRSELSQILKKFTPAENESLF